MNKKKRKEELRQVLLERRGRISEESYLQKSHQIISTLKQQAVFQKAEVIHCYLSMNRRREVNTRPLIKHMLKCGKKVVAPVTDIQSNTLRHVQLDRLDNLRVNAWGVPEPGGGNEVRVESLELIIVPMAGGDRQKNRIGYGKGFYDQFLQQVSCPAAGLVFERCVVDQVPVEPFDVPLFMLITENEIIK